MYITIIFTKQVRYSKIENVVQTIHWYKVQKLAAILKIQDGRKDVEKIATLVFASKRL